ncbi:glycerate kinase type-2 family protein [Veronia pacifica]|uniref:Hydroxypyruvate reductase n=1 Tax=Veronia pacifica TaxID=1080227 RepID=A0A1C3EG74_9GAMM|nr:hydroxypyruvate reductase [Veronia pacifica]
MEHVTSDPQSFLRYLFGVAVDAALPFGKLEQYLPEDKSGQLVVIGAGKAAASMAKELESCWTGPLKGLVVTRYQHGADCQHIEVVEASHPVPDDQGEKVARRMLKLVSELTEKDQVICLLSGGGSALLSLPADGVPFEEKRDINKALLRSGATISEINCVRKHLSAVKGGRLAKAAYPASMLTLAISDVPGDEPDVIASGPTVADPTTRQQASAILARYQISVSEQVSQWLASEDSETPKPGDPELSRSDIVLISTPLQSLEAVKQASEGQNIPAFILSDSIEGEARDIGMMHGAMAVHCATQQQPFTPPVVILSGGETTVTVKNKNGRGGRNCEFLLSLYTWMQNQQCRHQIHAIACDTDGIDGVEDNAGALLSPSLYHYAEQKNLNAAFYLDANNSYAFFEALNTLVVTGPTRTNVNDFRAILILPDP